MSSSTTATTRSRAPRRARRRAGCSGSDPAGDCLVVAKCEPGLASAVAVAIDRAGIEEIVGTVAGEDTIFIAVPERKAQRAVIKKVLELVRIVVGRRGRDGED